jgi:hypothetical protein
MKMEQTQCSETLEFKLQTPGETPEESIRSSRIFKREGGLQPTATTEENSGQLVLLLLLTQHTLLAIPAASSIASAVTATFLTG